MRAALVLAAWLAAAGTWAAGGVADWKKVEETLGSDKAAAALDDYLKSHTEGQLAARAGVERARLEENLEKAREYYEAAAKADPDGAWGARAVLELGKTDYAVGNYEKAMLELDTLVLDESNQELEPELLFWKAQSRYVLMGVKRARKDFEALAARYPKHALAPAARLGAAECAIATGDLDAAYKELVELSGAQSPVGAQALWQAAQVQEKKGIPAKALEHYRTLSERFPGSFEATQAAKKLAGKPMPEATAVPEPAQADTYSIQLGAFSREEGAQRLKSQAEKRKLTVFVKEIDVRGNRYHVVRVGRFPDKDSAERFARGLKKRTGWAYRVVSER